MPVFQEMTREELEAQKARLLEEYAAFQAKGLKLDMSRGKPGADQLDLSMKMLDVLHSASDVKSKTGWIAAIMVCLTASRSASACLPS